MLLGSAAAVCSVIPIVGTSSGLGSGGDLPHGQRTSLERHHPHRVGTAVIGMVDNIVRPLVIGSRVELHPLLLVFGLLGGCKYSALSGFLSGL